MVTNKPQGASPDIIPSNQEIAKYLAKNFDVDEIFTLYLLEEMDKTHGEAEKEFSKVYS